MEGNLVSNQSTWLHVAEVFLFGNRVYFFWIQQKSPSHFRLHFPLSHEEPRD